MVLDLLPMALLLETKNQRPYLELNLILVKILLISEMLDFSHQEIFHF